MQRGIQKYSGNDSWWSCCSKIEKELVVNFCDIKDNDLGYIKILYLSTWYLNHNYSLLKREYDSNQYTILYILCDDFMKICEHSKVNDFTEQLKLDVYRQIKDIRKLSDYRYNDAFKVAYKYFIYLWYLMVVKNKLISMSVWRIEIIDAMRNILTLSLL